MSCYSQSKVLEVLEKVFLISKLKDDEKNEDKYIKDIDGSWKLKEEIE
tara:strand:+ start:1228 stop:1371 length:144 start_codon:yes stop_codon:yes gene_type:complete